MSANPKPIFTNNPLVTPGLRDAALEIGERRYQTLLLIKEALQRGDNDKVVSLASELVGITDEHKESDRTYPS